MITMTIMVMIVMIMLMMMVDDTSSLFPEGVYSHIGCKFSLHSVDDGFGCDHGLQNQFHWF